MLIQIAVVIGIQVENEEQAEEARRIIDGGLDSRISPGFPHGEIIGVDVDDAKPLSYEEAEQRGWIE